MPLTFPSPYGEKGKESFWGHNPVTPVIPLVSIPLRGKGKGKPRIRCSGYPSTEYGFHPLTGKRERKVLQQPFLWSSRRAKCFHPLTGKRERKALLLKGKSIISCFHPLTGKRERKVFIKMKKQSLNTTLFPSPYGEKGKESRSRKYEGVESEACFHPLTGKRERKGFQRGRRNRGVSIPLRGKGKAKSQKNQWK